MLRLFLLVPVVGALSMSPRAPQMRPTARRTPPVRLGFEIEDIDQRAMDDLGVFAWPGLEKRSEDFTQSAGDDELLMVYVKDGAATLTDAEETLTVTTGQLVMVSDGEVRWSGLSDGGVTLLSTTTSMDGDSSPPKPGNEEVKDLSLKEATILLGAGLAAGGLLSFGVQKFVQ